MKFNYYPERVKPQPIKTLTLDGYLLVPGLNEPVDSIINHRAFPRMVEDNVIEVIEEKTAPPPATKKTTTKHKTATKAVEPKVLAIDVES